MGVEIERKFLVDRTKWHLLIKPEGAVFRQGYMLREPSKTVRVRVTDSRGFITIKGKTTGISRSEYEYEIPVNEGNELLSAFCDALINKIRYCISFAGKVWEVDVFSGDNDGLIIAEIELNDESEFFDLPDWIAEEVTGDERYYNSNLSIHPYKNWQ
jgi:adenylate cyclase